MRIESHTDMLTLIQVVIAPQDSCLGKSPHFQAGMLHSMTFFHSLDLTKGLYSRPGTQKATSPMHGGKGDVSLHWEVAESSLCHLVSGPRWDRFLGDQGHGHSCLASTLAPFLCPGRLPWSQRHGVAVLVPPGKTCVLFSEKEWA